MVHMATVAVLQQIDEAGLVGILQELGGKLNSADGEVVFDFSSLRRLDTSALRALEEFANRAREKSVRVVLRGVSVNVYKVLKLVKLSARFSFVN
jgi:anti-anti-sigma regulatory factor